MYKVIIVDDESLVIEGLKMSIDWERHGFRIAGSALNGLDALELIRQTEPELVFTDIRMPGLSGFELIKKAAETNPGTQFIVVSGYAEFAYAQMALKQGVFGYCLKPFDEEEIVSMLKKVKSSLDKVKCRSHGDFLELLEDSSVDSRQKIFSILECCDIRPDAGITVVASIGRGMLKMPENSGFLMLKPGTNKRAYLLNRQRDADLPGLLEKQPSKDISGIGLASAVNDVGQLKGALKDATVAAYQFFITGSYGVYTYRPPDSSEMNSCMKNLDKAMQDRDTVYIKECFCNLGKLFKKGDLNIKNAFGAYNYILALVLRHTDEDFGAYPDDYEQLAEGFANVYEMLDRMEILVDKSCGTIYNHAYEEIDNAVVKQILDYINGNFNKSLTVTGLSEKFFISPNYISYIFKKVVGQNFKEYLTRLRINYACELFANSEYSIQQIGEKAGYSDYFYFTRIFKSVTGLSPSQYRNEKHRHV